MCQTNIPTSNQAQLLKRFWEEGGSRYFGKIPKASKNSLQLCLKTIKIQARGRQKLKSGGLLGRFGDVLRHLGPVGAVLAAFWSVLEASLKSLGPKKVANMVPSWAPKREPNR